MSHRQNPGLRRNSTKKCKPVSGPCPSEAPLRRVSVTPKIAGQCTKNIQTYPPHSFCKISEVCYWQAFGTTFGRPTTLTSLLRAALVCLFGRPFGPFLAIDAMVCLFGGPFGPFLAIDANGSAGGSQTTIFQLPQRHHRGQPPPNMPLFLAPIASPPYRRAERVPIGHRRTRWAS
jgi:hypothetical protein